MSKATPISLTNMTAERRHQHTCKSTWGKAHEASNLHRITGNWVKQGWKRWPSPGKSTQTDYLVTVRQPWKHTYKKYYMDAIGYTWEYVCIYKYTYAHNNNWWKRPWIWRRADRDAWEGLERGKGRGNAVIEVQSQKQFCHNSQILKVQWKRIMDNTTYRKRG